MRHPALGTWLLGTAAVAALTALLWAAWSLAWGEADSAPGRATLSLPETLGGADTAGYARATAPRPFVFPEDHGPHPDYRTEWWYVTGNLETSEGRRFGVQLTLFRSALSPDGASDGGRAAGAGSSAWTTNQAYMAHLAVTDREDGRFHAFERFERGAVGLAGAEGQPFRVWVGDWEMRGSDSGIFPLTLSAREGDVALALDLVPTKPPVLQGDEGLSRKGPGPGDASYYYSYTRLDTRGEIVTPAGRFRVTGTTWLDREWSTSVLPEGVVGWDWFALHLDDGRELMLYELRRADGSRSPFSEGVLVAADGTAEQVSAEASVIEVLERWASPLDGTSYPSAWKITVPAGGLDLEVRPVLPDQELDLTFRYWEGAVDVTGSGAAGPISGHGYVELTGYGGAGPPRG